MRRHAAIQFPIGPAHMIGVEPWNRMSPVNTTSPSSSHAITSPWVWAGPTSSSVTARPPTSTVIEPEKVSVGGTDSMSSNRERPERVGDEPVAVLADVELLERVQQRGRDVVHLAPRPRPTR